MFFDKGLANFGTQYHAPYSALAAFYGSRNGHLITKVTIVSLGLIKPC